MCSSHVSENTMMSSTYTLQNGKPARTFCISLWNVAGALQRPNGMTRNSYRPFIVTNAVLAFALSAILICQYPLLASRVEKTFFPANWSRRSSIRGSGKMSFRVSIESSIINTKSKAPVLLLHQDNWTSPGTV